MRISDVAKLHHISEQAVRNRISRAGYKLSDLRLPGSNKFSPEGEQIISALFEKKPKQKAEKPAEKKTSLMEIKEERDSLRVQYAAALAVSEERAATISILRDEIKSKDEQLRILLAKFTSLPEPAEKANDDFVKNLKFWDYLKLRRMAKKGRKSDSNNK